MNSSDDSSLIIHHFNRQDEIIEEAQVQAEIEENANQEIIDIEYEEVAEETQHEEQLDQTETVQQEMPLTGTEGPGF